MQTWMYIMVPVTFYTCERLIRAFREKNYRVNIVKVNVN